MIGDTAALPGTIEGFDAYHDIVDIRQLTDPGAAVFNFDTATDKLTVTEGAQSVTLQLAGNLSGIVWQAGTDGHGGTDIEPPCFARGTLILTGHGEVPVEAWQIGDVVATLAGDLRPVKWIGRRSYRGAFLLRNSEVWPIRVTAGALGPGRRGATSTSRPITRCSWTASRSRSNASSTAVRSGAAIVRTRSNISTSSWRAMT